MSRDGFREKAYGGASASPIATVNRARLRAPLMTMTSLSLSRYATRTIMPPARSSYLAVTQKRYRVKFYPSRVKWREVSSIMREHRVELESCLEFSLALSLFGPQCFCAHNPLMPGSAAASPIRPEL